MIKALKEKKDIGKRRFIKLSQAKWEEIEQAGLYVLYNSFLLDKNKIFKKEGKGLTITIRGKKAMRLKEKKKKAERKIGSRQKQCNKKENFAFFKSGRKKNKSKY